MSPSTTRGWLHSAKYSCSQTQLFYSTHKFIFLKRKWSWWSWWSHIRHDGVGVSPSFSSGLSSLTLNTSVWYITIVWTSLEFKFHFRAATDEIFIIIFHYSVKEIGTFCRLVQKCCNILQSLQKDLHSGIIFADCVRTRFSLCPYLWVNTLSIFLFFFYLHIGWML